MVLVTKRARRELSALIHRYVKGVYGNVTGYRHSQLKRPTPRVSLCLGLEEQLRNRPAMRALVLLANSSRVKRKELLSTFNFAAFYLPHISKASRILYLDSDVIVRSDVAQLAQLHMQGRPVAAVEDCTQHIGRYIDFDLAEAYRRAAHVRVENHLGEGCGRAGQGATNVTARYDRAESPVRCEPLPRPLPDNATCVFNRGVLLLNRDVWLQQRLAEHIERHVVDFVHSRGALFRSGVSQPPFLLALANDYQRLHGEWNVRGLGRDAIGIPEWQGITAETSKFYAGFTDVENDLLGYMRLIATIRRNSAVIMAKNPSADVDQAQQSPSKHEDRSILLSWRERSLESHGNAFEEGQASETSPDVGNDATYRRSILAALDAAPRTLRGAELPERYKNRYPYVCPYAGHAKILHFNGEVKPWRMSAATVTSLEPLEGAICLWKDLEGRRTHGHQLFNASLTLQASHHLRKRRMSWCEKSIAACVTSCARDWHRYVAGYVADLRRKGPMGPQVVNHV